MMKETTLTNETAGVGTDPGPMSGMVAQVHVFDGEKYLGWDCFDSRRIRVGRSLPADLVLDDAGIDDIQAEFTVSNGRISVALIGRESGLTVNDKPVTHCTIGSFDRVKIGRYTVKIKLKMMEGSETVAPAQQAPSVSDPETGDTRLIEALGTLMKAGDNEIDSVNIEDILGIEKGKAIMDDVPPVRKPKSDQYDATLKVRIPEPPPEAKVSPENEKTIRIEHRAPVSASRAAAPAKATPPEPAAPVRKPAAAPVKPEPVSAERPVQARTAEPKPRKSPSLNMKPPVEEPVNTFPASFFTVIPDGDEDEDDDCPARFSLRDKLTGTAPARNRNGEKVLEIIRFRGSNVLSIAHLKNDGGTHVLVDDKDGYCHVNHSGKSGTRLHFSAPLLGTINRSGGTEFSAEKSRSVKGLLSKTGFYSSLLPVKGELTLSDGFYDFMIRESVLPHDPVIRQTPKSALPLHKRITGSTAFKYSSRALIFHIVLMFVLSYSITMPTKEEFKNPETYFVKVETDEIHKPVKPVPKPKPVEPAPIPAPDKAERKELAKNTPKETPKTAVHEQVASKPDTRVASTNESTRPAGEKTGNVENRNVKQVGLLGALGMKTGVSLKPNEALASVSNIDAVSSPHANEALVKVGGIKGSLGGGKVSIASGPVINNKSAADVYRSAGIGGKGTVGAIASGNTGKRAVKAVVSAPVAKRVNASGGGITREDVAKVINEHFSEIQNCYDTAVMNDPTLMGRIEFEWTILLSGEVADVKIKSSTIRSSQLHACITATIRSWKFPKPQGASVVVSYPFVFDVTGF